LWAVRVFLECILQFDDARLEVALVLKILGALNMLLFGEIRGAVASEKRCGCGKGQGYG